MQAMKTSPAPSRPSGAASSPTPITGTEMPAYATTNSAEITAARRSGGEAAATADSAPRNDSPCPAPPTSALATTSASWSQTSAPASRASPARSPAQPSGSERPTPTRPTASCPAVEAKKASATTAPLAARLCTSRDWARNAGLTEVNTPNSAKPTNAAIAAGANTARTCGGRPGRCGRTVLSGRRSVTVSGSPSRTPAEAATRTRCTAKVR